MLFNDIPFCQGVPSGRVNMIAALCNQNLIAPFTIEGFQQIYVNLGNPITTQILLDAPPTTPRGKT